MRFVLVAILWLCCSLVMAQVPPGPPTNHRGVVRTRPIAEATRVERAPKLDGTLEDPIWQHAIPITNFLQREPFEGQQPTERTEVRLQVYSGTHAHRLYRGSDAIEDYYCNYGVNPVYRHALEEGGLVVSGVGPEGEVRMVEITSHPFFIATLFLPQTRSSAGLPHPLIAGFAEVVRERRRETSQI